MDWEAQDDGFVAKILAEEGSKDISVGSPVIVLVEEEVLLPISNLNSEPVEGLEHCFENIVSFRKPKQAFKFSQD